MRVDELICPGCHMDIDDCECESRPGKDSKKHIKIHPKVNGRIEHIMLEIKL